jgi:aspartyl-tRNA(Asn)/glutamyl-tRNA(Gln) amidotransferase subunit C
VNTDGVEGTAHATARINAFREDEPAGHLERDAALDNAPEQGEGAFIVPKVIE